MKKPLSPRQQEVYALILAAHRARQPAPTYREIGDALSISSTNAVADHVEALVKKGWVSRGPAGQARTLVPVVKRAAGLTGRVRVLEAEIAALTEERDRLKDRVQVERDEVERLRTMLNATQAKIDGD